MKTPSQALHGAAERLESPVRHALEASARTAHRLNRATHHIAHDAASAVRTAEGKISGTTRHAARDAASYVRKHPVQTLLWFAAGTALVGALARFGRS